MTSFRRSMVAVLLAVLAVSVSRAAEPVAAQSVSGSTGARVNEAHMGLASAALIDARLGELPEGTLVQSGDIVVSQAEVTAEIAKAAPELRASLEKNGFFLAEQLATQRLIIAAARADVTQPRPKTEETDQALIQGFFVRLTEAVSVSDADVADFYKNNAEACGGATLSQARDSIRQYLLGQKKQDAVTQYIKTMGQRRPITVSTFWAEKQAVLANDNPVNKARASGKPSLIDFGSKGCRPCDMLAPILETLKTKYEGKANILFVSVPNEPILAGRYGIESIPVQIFFDKNGKETFRHVGFYPQEELEKKLAEAEVH